MKFGKTLAATAASGIIVGMLVGCGGGTPAPAAGTPDPAASASAGKASCNGKSSCNGGAAGTKASCNGGSTAPATPPAK